MAAVQRMRTRAQTNGKLSSTPQQTVTTETQGGQTAIEIAPADPQVIYVPQYDPMYVWGPPAWGYYPPLDYYGYGFGFGPAIDIGFCFGGWGGWGWGGWGWGWGPNWFGRSVFVNYGFFNHYGFHGGYGAGGFGGRREPPFGGCLPEQPASRPVWRRVARFAERDGQVRQFQFAPSGQCRKLEPLWIIRAAGNPRHGAAERRPGNRGPVATLPGVAAEFGPRTALLGPRATVFGSSATLFGSGATLFSSGTAILRSRAAVFGPGAALSVCPALVRSQLWRWRRIAQFRRWWQLAQFWRRP
jgi:hypothetical protein